MDNYPQKQNSTVNILEILKVFFSFSLVYLLFFAPVLFSNRLLAPGDGIIQSVPAFYAPRTLWTDSLYSGFPAAADPTIQHWYPVSLLFSWIPHSWNGFMLSAYVLASCFTYGYVYKLTKSRFAAAFSGLVYGMNGFMMAHLGHTSMIHTAAWIPLIIWSLEELRGKLTRQWFLTGCLAIACCILAGHPQISVYGFVLAAAYVLVCGWSAVVGRWRYYQVCLAIAVLGVTLGAIQIIPTAELASLGLRPEMTFEEFNSFSLPPIEAIKLIFPFILGASHPLPWLYDTPYFGSWNFVEMAGYAGITTLLMALAGLMCFDNRTVAKFWAFTALVCFLLTLGNVTPLAWITFQVPILNSFKAPARHLLEISFAFSVLAGMGLSGITRQLLSQKQLFKIIMGSSTFLSLLLIVLFLSKDTILDEIRDEVSQEAARQYTLLPWSNLALGIPLLIFIGAIIFLVGLTRFPSNKIVKYSLLAFLIFDLGSFGWFCEWQYESPSVNIVRPTAVVQKYAQILDRTDQRILPIRGIKRKNWSEMPANVSRLWGIPNASGYGPMILLRVSKLLSLNTPGNVVFSTWDSRENRSLDLMAIRYVTTPRDLTEISYRDLDGKSYAAPENNPNLEDSSRWRLAEHTAEASIYENLRARPRIWLVAETVKLTPDEILETIQSSSLPDGRIYDPAQMALVEAGTIFKTEQFDSEATTKITQVSDTHLEITTQSSSPAFLVLSDVNYPGWHAKIDGKTTKIWQTNYVLRGIALPSGVHTVELKFKPHSFHLGLGITSAAFFLCIYLGLVRRKNWQF